MFQRAFGILLTLGVMLAVGVCPCGLDRFFQAIAPVASTVSTSIRLAADGCPACHAKQGKPVSGDARSDDGRSEQKCSQTVAGDVPGQHVVAPALDLTPLVFLPFVSIDSQPVLAIERPFARPAWLPPPPTLISLSCCLTV